MGPYAELATDHVSVLRYAASLMNRIAELRRLKGWSQEELGGRVGAHKMTIHRLENGHTELTVTWMNKLARAFGCSAADLLDFAAMADTDDDVELASLEGFGPVAAAIAKKGLKAYTVKGGALALIGIKPGSLITVDESSEAVAGVRTGDAVLVKMTGAKTVLVLRQYLAPSLLTTNREGGNLAVSLSDPALKPAIVGVILSE